MNVKKLQTPDGVELTYYVAGAGGTTLVITNAPGMSVRFWLPIIRLLEDRFRLVAFEYRGFPEAKAELTPAQLRFENHVSDLERILEVERATPAHFLSWCAGTSLAAAYYQRHPEHVLSLASVGATVGYRGEASPFVEMMRDVRAAVERDPTSVDRMVTMMRNIGVVPDESFFLAIHEEGEDSPALDLVDMLERESSTSNLAFLLIDQPVGLRNYLRVLDEFLEHRTEADCVERPITLINGSGDGFVRAQDGSYVDPAARRLDVTEVTIPHGSHFVLLERPDVVARHLVEHVERVEASRRAASPRLQVLRAAARAVLGDDVWVDDRPSRALSSLELMRVALRIERDLGVRFGDRDLGPEHFASFTAILRTLAAATGNTP